MSAISDQKLITEEGAHRAWLRECLDRAAREVGAESVDAPVFGWRDRTIGAAIDSARRRCWLRVVAEAEQWAGGNFWIGNREANTITGVIKPTVLRDWEWAEGSWRLRAELMTFVSGRPCSVSPDLRDEVDLPLTWWAQLRSSLRNLAATHTERVFLTGEHLARQLMVFFGNRVPVDVSRWEPAHTDLHWANLLAPDCAIVDWEGWGLAPAGYDAATLYLHSLVVPKIANQVGAHLDGLLHSTDGLVSQLHVTARMLLRINDGDYGDLALPLHHNAERVIAELTTRY